MPAEAWAVEPRAQHLVLVVEDDGDQRYTICDVLAEAGYDVVEATDGREALELLRDGAAAAPALVLLDLSMPIMTGWELLAVLRKEGWLERVPVLVMSGTDLLLDPGRHGAVAGVLLKPFGVPQLLQAVARFVVPLHAA